MNRQTILPAIVALLVAALTGCRPEVRSYPTDATFTPGPALAEFTESGVRVAVSLETDDQHRPLLRATFTPLDPGFHLYGKDIPETGVQGVGRPTRIDIPAQSSIRVAGPSFSDVQPHDERFDVLGVTLPIYPEGPVTLHLPVELSPAHGAFTAQLTFSYMACQSDGQCRMPVNRKLVETKIPTIQ